MKKALLLLILVSFAFAKDHTWQEGRVLRLVPVNHGAAAMPVGNIMVAVPLGHLQYEVEFGDIVLLAVTNKNINITLGRIAKIAIENQNLYLVDDSGKTQKLKIVAKKLKEAPPA